MTHRRYPVRPSTPVYVLAASRCGLAWQALPISRITPRSVFLLLIAGEIQLCRQELESRGRCDVAGEVFSLTPFELPSRERGVA